MFLYIYIKAKYKNNKIQKFRIFLKINNENTDIR